MAGALAGFEPNTFLEALASPGDDLDCAIMVVVAHPDDETIGIGGQLARFRQVRIAHLTDGAPADMKDAGAHGFSSREAYAAARRRELETAMAEARIGPDRLIPIGVADQTAAHRLPCLVRRTLALLRAHRPAVIVTHAYEGGHPDHDATAFVVHAARQILRRDGDEPPALIEMPLYHARQGEMIAQQFVASSLGGPALPETAIRLDEAALAAKRRMLAAHTTQQKTLEAFDSPIERFRAAPSYDFGRLPNGGALYYERFGWGTSGAQWLRYAAEARRELGLPPWL